MQGGRRETRPAAVNSSQPDSFGMFVLRLWMWAVPVMMLAAAVVFGGIAVADGKRGLFVVMLFMGAIAVSLFVFHWWVLYRFGSKPR
jgi:hypothetical protein